MWVGESAEKNGEAIPKEQAAQIRVHFDGGNVRITMPGGKSDEGTFKLDPEVNPKQIDCSGAADQKTRYGIYRFPRGRPPRNLHGRGKEPLPRSSIRRYDAATRHLPAHAPADPPLVSPAKDGRPE